MKKYNIKFFYPNFFTNRAIAYVCLSLSENMASDIFNTSVMGIASSKEINVERYTDAIPRLFIGLAYKFLDKKTLVRFAEYRFKKTVNDGDIVYLWPGSSVDLFKSLKKKGCVIVRENINTHAALSDKLLTIEYTLLGLEYNLKNAKALTKDETELQDYSDFVFSPSPIVTRSLIEFGVSSSSVLDVSYGLKDNEIFSNTKERNYNDDHFVTAIFVGLICIRKGVHLLLDAWKKANINGRLLLVGKIEDNISDIVNKSLSGNVEHISYTNNLLDLYASADFFILPSIEEGSPLVTYLALGAGLPSIVSPMGAGGIVEGNMGFIIEPGDQASWISAIQSLASNGKLRESMGKHAHIKAKQYTWDKVGKKRAEILLSKLTTYNNIN